jgi:hypothetical protein
LCYFPFLYNPRRTGEEPRSRGCNTDLANPLDAPPLALIDSRGGAALLDIGLHVTNSGKGLAKFSCISRQSPTPQEVPEANVPGDSVCVLRWTRGGCGADRGCDVGIVVAMSLRKSLRTGIWRRVVEGAQEVSVPETPLRTHTTLALLATAPASPRSSRSSRVSGNKVTRDIAAHILRIVGHALER